MFVKHSIYFFVIAELFVKIICSIYCFNIIFLVIIYITLWTLCISIWGYYIKKFSNIFNCNISNIVIIIALLVGMILSTILGFIFVKEDINYYRKYNNYIEVYNDLSDEVFDQIIDNQKDYLEYKSKEKYVKKADFEEVLIPQNERNEINEIEDKMHELVFKGKQIRQNKNSCNCVIFQTLLTDYAIRLFNTGIVVETNDIIIISTYDIKAAIPIITQLSNRDFEKAYNLIIQYENSSQGIYDTYEMKELELSYKLFMEEIENDNNDCVYNDSYKVFWNKTNQDIKYIILHFFPTCFRISNS